MKFIKQTSLVLLVRPLIKSNLICNFICSLPLSVNTVGVGKSWTANQLQSEERLHFDWLLPLANQRPYWQKKLLVCSDKTVRLDASGPHRKDSSKLSVPLVRVTFCCKIEGKRQWKARGLGRQMITSEWSALGDNSLNLQHKLRPTPSS